MSDTKNSIIATENSLPSKSPKSPITSLFDDLGIGPVKRTDSFVIQYAEDIITVTKKSPDGSVQMVRKTLGNKGFTELVKFDPNELSKDQRNHIIERLSKDGLSQSEIARRIGFSQPTVSNVLRRKNAN